MLTHQVAGGGGRGGEFLRVEVPTASNAMDVRVLLTPTSRRIQVFAFAFREPLGSLHVAALNRTWVPGVKRVLRPIR